MVQAEARRAALLTSWGFQCFCAACVHDDGVRAQIGRLLGPSDQPGSIGFLVERDPAVPPWVAPAAALGQAAWAAAAAIKLQLPELSRVAHRRAGALAELMGQPAAAVLHFERATQLGAMLLGREHPEARACGGGSAGSAHLEPHAVHRRAMGGPGPATDDTGPPRCGAVGCGNACSVGGRASVASLLAAAEAAASLFVGTAAGFAGAVAGPAETAELMAGAAVTAGGAGRLLRIELEHSPAAAVVAIDDGTGDVRRFDPLEVQCIAAECPRGCGLAYCSTACRDRDAASHRRGCPASR